MHHLDIIFAKPNNVMFAMNYEKMWFLCNILREKYFKKYKRICKTNGCFGWKTGRSQNLGKMNRNYLIYSVIHMQKEWNMLLNHFTNKM